MCTSQNSYSLFSSLAILAYLCRSTNFSSLFPTPISRHSLMVEPPKLRILFGDCIVQMYRNTYLVPKCRFQLNSRRQQVIFSRSSNGFEDASKEDISEASCIYKGVAGECQGARRKL